MLMFQRLARLLALMSLVLLLAHPAPTRSARRALCPRDILGMGATPLQAGLELARRGQLEQSIACLQQADRELKSEHQKLRQRSSSSSSTPSRSAATVLEERTQALMGLAAAYASLPEQADYAAAEKHLRTALRLAGATAEMQAAVHTQLGQVLYLQGKLSEAADSLQQALARLPDNPSPAMYLASICEQRGDYAEALELYQRVAALVAAAAAATPMPLPPSARSMHVAALTSAARMQLMLGQAAGAKQLAKAALVADKDSSAGLLMLAAAELALGRYAAATKALQRGLELAPESTHGRSLQLELHRRTCNWRARREDLQDARDLLVQQIAQTSPDSHDGRALYQAHAFGTAVSPWQALHYPELPERTVKRAAEHAAAIAAAKQSSARSALVAHRRQTIVERDPAQPLRIGLLGTFGAGLVAPANSTEPPRWALARLSMLAQASLDAQVQGWLQAADPDIFSFVLYDLDHSAASASRPETELTGAASARLVPARNLTAHELAERVRADGVHILLDLTPGGDDPLATLVLAAQPAPVQATAFASCGTTGAPSVAFAVSDPYTAPEPVGKQLAESVVHVPSALLAPKIPPLSAAAAGRDAAQLRQQWLKRLGIARPDARVLCHLGDPGMMGEDAYNSWLDVLERAPEDTVLLMPYNPAKSLARAMKDRKLSPDRLVLAKFENASTAVEAAQALCVAHLESPANLEGGLISALMLGAGVPVLAVDGKTSRCNRQAAGAVRLAGGKALGSLAAQRRAALALLRDGTSDAVQVDAAAPLFDHQAFAEHMEDALLFMWAHAAKDAQPRLLELPNGAMEEEEEDDGTEDWLTGGVEESGLAGESGVRVEEDEEEGGVDEGGYEEEAAEAASNGIPSDEQRQAPGMAPQDVCSGTDTNDPDCRRSGADSNRKLWSSMRVREDSGDAKQADSSDDNVFVIDAVAYH